MHRDRRLGGFLWKKLVSLRLPTVVSNGRCLVLGTSVIFLFLASYPVLFLYFLGILDLYKETMRDILAVCSFRFTQIVIY